MWRRLDNVPRLNIHSAKTLTCGTPWSVAWGAYVSGCGGWWEAWRGQILRGASFALVWCREERGASASKAGNILVIQVIVAIIFGKRERSKVYMRLFRAFSCSYTPAGMYWGVAG